MNIRNISALRDRYRAPAMSRRRFGRLAGSAAAASSAFGLGLWRPRPVEASRGSSQPVPIPGGTPALGGVFHVFGPAAGDPVDAEPSTITDFNGFVGLAYIDGMVTRTKTSTGEQAVLPFLDTDMRFMEGEFRGADGRMHHGAFAFV